MAGRSLSYRIETGFVLPVIIAAAQHQAGLGPYDLRPNQEAASIKTLGNGLRVNPRVPDVSDLARKQAPSFTPIGAVIIVDPAGPRGRGNTGFDSPIGIVLDAVGRVGHHQVRMRAIEETL